MSSPPNFLVITLDLETLLTGLSTQNNKWDLNFVLVSLTTFCNSFCLMNRGNKLAIIVYHQNGANFVFPNLKQSTLNNKDLIFNPPLADLQTSIISAFDSLMKERPPTTEKSERSHLSSALSTALSIINKQRQLSHFQFRLLNIQFDKELLHSYNSIMNSIFSAQKLNVIVDSLILSPFDSHLMQQACFLTGGLYIKHVEWGDFVILLQTYFLADNRTRSFLTLPQQKTVDFKASCFCHKKPVEFAYMCTICLTLLCDAPTKCPVCQFPVNI